MPDRRTILSWDENKDCQTKGDNSHCQTLINMGSNFLAALLQSRPKKRRLIVGQTKLQGKSRQSTFLELKIKVNRATVKLPC